MGRVLKFGQMEPVMKGSGRKTKPMGRASSGMLMVIFMREIGEMTRQMGMVYTNM